MTEVVAPISLDGMAVHPDYSCICLCYLYFAPENPEDGKMYLLVPAHPGCPGQGPQSCKMVVCVCVCHDGTVTKKTYAEGNFQQATSSGHYTLSTFTTIHTGTLVLWPSCLELLEFITRKRTSQDNWNQFYSQTRCPFSCPTGSVH